MALHSTSMGRLLFVGLLGAGLLPASGARCDRVAVPVPRTVGVETPAQREGFRASLAGGLASAGHEVVSSSVLEQAIATSPALRDCDTDTCMVRLGELTTAGAVLRSSVELLGSSNYHFHLDLYDARARRVASSVDDTCTICTTREANEALSRTAAALGRLIPSSPAPGLPAVASPTLSTDHPPRPVTYATPRSRLFLGLGLGSLVLGLGAVGGGAALFAIDGRTRDGVDEMGQPTRSTLSTVVPGAILVTAGGLCLAGAGILLWRSVATRSASAAH